MSYHLQKENHLTKSQLSQPHPRALSLYISLYIYMIIYVDPQVRGPCAQDLMLFDQRWIVDMYAASIRSDAMDSNVSGVSDKCLECTTCLAAIQALRTPHSKRVPPIPTKDFTFPGTVTLVLARHSRWAPALHTLHGQPYKLSTLTTTEYRIAWLWVHMGNLQSLTVI